MNKLILMIALLSIGCTGIGGYCEGQFAEQTGTIKLNAPEPDTNEFLQQKKADRLHIERWGTSDSDWEKRCEWWLKRDLGF